jgi:hypothetical protein
MRFRRCPKCGGSIAHARVIADSRYIYANHANDAVDPKTEHGDGQ